MVNTRKVAKPFLKWAGGKQSLATRLIAFVPPDYHTYYEPFIGGGSMFLTLQPNLAVIGDENDWLIDCYLAVRDHWQEVADLLDRMKNTKEAYLNIRKIHPAAIRDTKQRAAQLIYLNKTCFRGLFRVNRRGQFNVPYGAYKRRYYDRGNLAAVSEALQNAELRCGDFESNLDHIASGDFAYLDPPYFKMGGYSDFNRYTPSQFREADHIRLADLCRRLDRRGIRWAMSNSNTAFIRDVFSGFKFHEISARREINLNSGRRNIVELLVTNYDVEAMQAGNKPRQTEEEESPTIAIGRKKAS